MFIITYLKSYFFSEVKNLIGGHSYTKWQKEYYELKEITLKNPLIAQELQSACERNHGYLTFAEYLHVDQFGENGYHNKHLLHGFQSKNLSLWGKALANICHKQNIQHVVDIGCGDGSLGVSVLNEARKFQSHLLWSGVEINEQIHKQIHRNFRNKYLEKQLHHLTTTLSTLPTLAHTLLIFSYSLDSIPPEIFTNTRTVEGYPDTLIGITCKDNILKEKYLSNSDLEKKNISLKNGIFTDNTGKQFDLSHWRLHPGQRAYLPIQSFSTVWDSVNRYPDAFIVIIDEFFTLDQAAYYEHVSPPRNLLAFTRTYGNSAKIYYQTGDNLYYYAIFLKSILTVLTSLGCKDIKYDTEEKMAKESLGEKIKSLNHSSCLAIFANIQYRKQKVLVIDPPYPNDYSQ